MAACLAVFISSCSESGSSSADFCETFTEPPTELGETGDFQQELVDSAPSKIREDVILVYTTGVDAAADQVATGSDEYKAAEERMRAYLREECGVEDG